MSRVLNGTLSTDLQGGVYTLARCFEITRKDGTVVRLTDHHKDITFLGNTYLSDGGFTTSAMESGENLAVDNSEMKVLFRSTAVDRSDIINGVYDGAAISVWLVNYLNPSNYTALPGAFINRSRSSELDSGIFEVTSKSSKLNQSIGRIAIPMCDADVGDLRCGVNLASFTVTGTITSVTSNSVFTDSSRTEANDYFNTSVLTFTSGPNNGIKCQVKDFGSGQFILLDPPPNNVSVSDTYSVYAGCDQLSDTCKNTFNNFINFRGLPFNIDNLSLVGGA